MLLTPHSFLPESKADVAPRVQRSKNGTVRRSNHGLVRGTGRIQPNGALKRSDPTKEQHLPEKKVIAEPAPEPARPRTRTIIDQSPIPLYCSDECRMADLQSSFGSVSLDYNPDRHRSPPLPPVPQNSLDDLASHSDSSSSSTSVSVSATESTNIFANLPPSPYPENPGPAGSNVIKNQAEACRLASARAYAALQSIYDLPPPPPPPLVRTNTASSASSDEIPNDYQSGVMMAAKRIGDALIRRPQPKKRPSWATPQSALSTQYALDNLQKREVIPGWTDGSHAWRSHVYSFAPPPKDGVYNPNISAADDPALKAYRGHVSTPLRSKGVYSTVTDTSVGVTSSSSSLVMNPTPSSSKSKVTDRSQSNVEELYSKFSASLNRRCESRQSLNRGPRSTSPTGSTRSLPTTIGSSRRREVPLVAPGAEGRLLVPDVKMRRVSSSGSETHGFARKKSPLSRHGSEMSVIEDEAEDEVPVTRSSKGKKPVEGELYGSFCQLLKELTRFRFF